jgi:hypothetical protein
MEITVMNKREKNRAIFYPLTWTNLGPVCRWCFYSLCNVSFDKARTFLFVPDTSVPTFANTGDQFYLSRTKFAGRRLRTPKAQGKQKPNGGPPRPSRQKGQCPLFYYLHGKLPGNFPCRRFATYQTRIPFRVASGHCPTDNGQMSPLLTTGSG